MDAIGFGRGVRALRMRSRLTQEQVSAKAGVSRSVVARIEQGRGERVTVATLERVAAASAGG
jgi:transcriptional regulator with XRE-family HTH domain